MTSLLRILKASFMEKRRIRRWINVNIDFNITCCLITCKQAEAFVTAKVLDVKPLISLLIRSVPIVNQ